MRLTPEASVIVNFTEQTFDEPLLVNVRETIPPPFHCDVCFTDTVTFELEEEEELEDELEELLQLTPLFSDFWWAY